MVKIVNQFGDVKIGKQGEVVYQRKHGEQIRRQVSPKRAIPSQSQLAHRQLYRAALDWRKQLSLANRRYLDGYCISNWIVDSYKLPLAWSRFALKLYLQKVQFVVITKALAGQAGEVEKRQYYDQNGNVGRHNYGVYWTGQTFTPQATHTLTKLRLMLTGKGTEDVIISIQGVDGSDHPDGVDISQVIVKGEDFPAHPNYAWVAFTMPEVTLQNGTMYAIVARCPTGDASNQYFYWYQDSAGATYPRGAWEYTNDSGTSWQTQAGGDMYFEEWGYAPGVAGQLGLIHVRHPALLAVVHKRGEHTINEWDTLSSLDQEYLTGQVGLDVEPGDVIEATTLPGIDYRHEAG
ncbi:hypothetical protein LCGC14_0921800 [marine sediment metagenome]|uniref:Uncharacterized protein n=1 Tax=marine sediment metagenome TaxID=412755 RepID=A0A0F9NQN2_9ZZZZ